MTRWLILAAALIGLALLLLYPLARAGAQEHSTPACERLLCYQPKPGI